MPDFKKIETTVLLTMLTAHSVHYRRLDAKKGNAKYERTANRIQSEIELRKKGGTDRTDTNPDI